MDVLVAVVIVLVVVVICKVVESQLRKPLIDRITDRYVFITGCDTGFGNQLARQLDKKGVRVIAACLTEKGRTALDKVTSERLATLLLDVTNHESILKAYQSVKESLPNESALWGVVNNAGIAKPRGFLEFSQREDYENIAAVNLFGAIDVTLTFLPLLKSGGGRFVQVTSVAGRIALPLAAGGYNEAKFGFEAFSDNVRRECIRLGYPIRVSIIEPGYFKTHMADENDVTNHILDGWARLSDQEKQQFPRQVAEDRANLMTSRIRSMATQNLTYMTDCVEHALLARWPRTRYAAGWDARCLWIPISYLPTIVSDRIIAYT